LYNKSTLKTKFNDQVAALDRLRQEKDALEKSLRQENETLQRSLDAKKAQLHESQKEASRLKLQASRAALAAKADAIVQARLDDDEDGIEVDEETSLTFKEFYKDDSERHKGEQLLATITSLLGTLERGKDKNGGLRGKRSGKFPASIMSYCFWMLNRLGKPKYINWQKLHPEYPVYSTVSNYTTEFRVPQV
jgi:hypothetical protein